MRVNSKKKRAVNIYMYICMRVCVSVPLGRMIRRQKVGGHIIILLRLLGYCYVRLTHFHVVVVFFCFRYLLSTIFLCSFVCLFLSCIFLFHMIFLLLSMLTIDFPLASSLLLRPPSSPPHQFTVSLSSVIYTLPFRVKKTFFPSFTFSVFHYYEKHRFIDPVTHAPVCLFPKIQKRKRRIGSFSLLFPFPSFFVVVILLLFTSPPKEKHQKMNLLFYLVYLLLLA
ncbi:hypothetical protein TbgDal_III350 [Trypanosoma brucei gambiense DAL972]|uniref:Uncharacterized protein n=1 Tax=Trypanosoma brucei gambiense (strain MHOM/CI/86/DAL972) TaxID=679716 RepID=C9ZKV3_TRYB9|nr:hypothetical protein TbgDal_III350 [Trypanosoma brucei gambiense DAL972]CBH09696.1 hypothetical protein TbgDal_III350 [Trypanosoma brucei gambiense DAL972]|eukprot:XP_011771989.1 hypothetical protein TbgDal_III350 [Trypanosoma brucei gambiense DAL972]